MKKSKILFFTLLFTLAAGGSAFAVSAGAGGSPTPPPCSGDTWTCGDWSACGADGTQTRVCTLTVNCPTAETPKPAESQGCQPMSAPAPKKPSIPAPAPSPEPQGVTPPETGGGRGGTPPTPGPSIPVCAEDTWNCTEWSQCQQNGRNTRTCTLAVDCPSAVTPKPEEEKPCEGLKCASLDTLEERVKCRVALSPDELAAENKILYFPEYCKLEETQDKKMECIKLYQSFLPCWQMPAGPDRIQCGKDVIGLQKWGTESSACVSDTGADPVCVGKLREKVKNYLLFSLYELEFQAESLLAAGRVESFRAVNLDVYIENEKAKLADAATVTEWGNILTEANAYWNQFISNVK